jgi:menaquinone-9 beta-reductase
MIYDLIIVGGGPAGATAAMYAARHGLKTLLVDKSRFPRDKICGDAIGGHAVAILRDLQLDDALANLSSLRFRKMVLGSAAHVEAEIDLDRARKQDFVIGYVIRRQVFDAFLFDHARAAAATCLEGFAVDDVIWENGGVCGVVGRDTGSDFQREFRARIVVGADGYRSVVARKVGRYAINPAHWMVAIRRYYRNVVGLSDRIELHYVSAVTPGYFWIFPLPDGLANVGIGMLLSAMKRKRVNLTEALDLTLRDRYFAPRFADAVPIEKPVGWHLPVGSVRRPCCGPGYLLAGDAAGLIDPWTGEGIANAMYSGRVAAAEAAAALEVGDVSAASLAHYDRQLWAGIGEALAISTKLRRIGGIPSLLNFTIRKAAQNQEVKDTLCAMISEEISRKQMTSPLFYLKLLAK